MPDIKKIIVQEILIKATALKNEYTNESNAKAAWVCIFSQTDKEYKELLKEAEKLGNIFESTLTGPKFLLNEPIAETVKILKIRKPDPKKPERGDADFSILNFQNFKKYCEAKNNFKIIPKNGFEMIELTKPESTVRVYFSNPPIEQQYQDFLKNNMENKNCIIIHGCPENSETAINFEANDYNKHWISWTKQELMAHNIITETPMMPEPWSPDYEKFKNKFEQGNINDQTILIGHSCGCAFLVRWLGETKRKILKLILVAPWKINDRKEAFREAFYSYPVDKTIKERVGKIIIFTADNEEADGKASLNIFHKALGGKIIELKARGHYTFSDMETEEFPELINEVLS